MKPPQPGLSLCLLFPLRYEIPDTQTADEKQLEILQDKANFRNFKPKPFNMLEFYDRAGHDIREMLLSCFFRGEQCSPEDFKVVSAPSAPSPGCEFHARKALVCPPPFLPPSASQRKGSSIAEGVPGDAAGAQHSGLCGVVCAGLGIDAGNHCTWSNGWRD